MKIFACGLVLCFASTLALADTAPNRKLVEQYIEQARLEQQTTAQVEGYAEQLTANGTPEQKDKLVQYLSQSMGWNAIKDQYATLLKQTYTTEELKAVLAFLNSPKGRLIVAKNAQFSYELAKVMARNGQASAQGQLGANTRSASAAELVISDVEEKDNDGRTFFLGKIENKSKRSAKGVQIEVNLFMAGKFVDQYSTYVPGAIEPAGFRYFKVACGCKDSPPARHDSFKINVIDSGY
jgi:hypothetical protein